MLKVEYLMFRKRKKEKKKFHTNSVRFLVMKESVLNLFVPGISDSLYEYADLSTEKILFSTGGSNRIEQLITSYNPSLLRMVRHIFAWIDFGIVDERLER